MPRIVFDPLAEADFIEHFDIEFGALFQALSLHQLRFGKKCRPLYVEFFLDAFQRTQYRCSRRYIVAGWIHREARKTLADFTGQRIKQLKSFNFIIE